jgi:peptide/nickel transport system permease protein
VTAYIVRRLLLFIPTLVIVITAVFLLIRMIPGDTVTIMVEDNQYAESADALRERLGLNEPIYRQYMVWVADLVRGDFGTSLHSNRSTWDEVRARGPVSLQLGIMSLAVSLAIAIPIGIVSAARAGSLVDFGSRSFAIAMLAMPSFWLATLAIVIPSVLWNTAIVQPYVHIWNNPLESLQVMIIPAFVGGAAGSASIMRMTRTMTLEVLRQDYVRTAMAKGLQSRVVMSRHVLKNAMIPVITMIGLQVPIIISGSVIMEQVFSLPGMGRFLLQSITLRDYPMVQAMTLLFTVVVLTVNLVIDLMYPILDPRIDISR